MTYRANAAPAWEPTHPGQMLREDILPELGLSIAQAAEKLRVSRQALYNVVSERAAVSPEMAARLGKLCGSGPGIWLRLQQARDLWLVEHELADELAAIPSMASGAGGGFV